MLRVNSHNILLMPGLQDYPDSLRGTILSWGHTLISFGVNNLDGFRYSSVLWIIPPHSWEGERERAQTSDMSPLKLFILHVMMFSIQPCLLVVLKIQNRLILFRTWKENLFLDTLHVLWLAMTLHYKEWCNIENVPKYLTTTCLCTCYFNPTQFVSKYFMALLRRTLKLQSEWAVTLEMFL